MNIVQLTPATAIGCYLIGINIITFLIYLTDKYKAKHHLWRTRESTLLFLAVIGGSVGALVAIFVFRHKSLHIKFRYGVPLILLLQLTVTYWLIR